MISSCLQLSETWVTRAIYYACNVHDGINLNSIERKGKKSTFKKKDNRVALKDFYVHDSQNLCAFMTK